MNCSTQRYDVSLINPYILFMEQLVDILNLFHANSTSLPSFQIELVTKDWNNLYNDLFKKKMSSTRHFHRKRNLKCSMNVIQRKQQPQKFKPNQTFPTHRTINLKKMTFQYPFSICLVPFSRICFFFLLEIERSIRFFAFWRFKCRWSIWESFIKNCC